MTHARAFALPCLGSGSTSFSSSALASTFLELMITPTRTGSKLKQITERRQDQSRNHRAIGIVGLFRVPLAVVFLVPLLPGVANIVLLLDPLLPGVLVLLLDPLLPGVVLLRCSDIASSSSTCCSRPSTSSSSPSQSSPFPPTFSAALY